MKASPRTKAGILAVGRIAARDEAVLNSGGVRAESVIYDFDLDGGAAGTYPTSRYLPAGAVVVRVWTDEQTAVTGADDVDLVAGSTDLVTAVDFTLDAGLNSRALAGAADAIKLSAASELKVVINTNDATAGRVRFYVEYLLPNDGQE